MDDSKELLILASASTARAQLLRGAGLTFETRPSDVDEDELKTTMKAEGAEATAGALAELKARHVAKQAPGSLVIGADQLLDCKGDWFDKARDRDDADKQLRFLRGKDHRLFTSVCAVQDGACLWRFTGAPRLKMRDFSDSFIESYLESAGDEAFGCVGAYRLEGLGAQLFAEIEGDYFTILGLPLLPLLDFLRSRGIVAA
ncbi:MAG: Maf family nucleotide pyrophosphatase [Proteobacteria bacterium]|nr:Maf family nucleotide pyrophosphatase [Pseudomonadota bacterium]MDA1356218.1 Maf family nucleotide pyrophosphatase [Pseudomonadota bacterium]